VRILADHHVRQGSRPSATVLGLRRRLGTVAAAAVNGAAMHVLDFEPMWSPANHALSTTLPAVLALGEDTGASGEELVTALVKGVEMQGWLRQASRQWEAEDLVFHPPGVVGPIGAAVAAGHLLDLDADRLRHAVGIAASRAGGLMANVGTMTKATHCGHACALGLEAALLAGSGFTANADVFDAPRGFAETFFARFAAEELMGFGPPFRVVEPGFAIKLFPSQFGTHFGITAGLAARAEVADASAITAVRLTAPPMAYVDRPFPATGLDGKFSLQYTLAAALLDGRVGIATFTDERLARADMQALLARTELIVATGRSGRFEEMEVAVEVDLADGRCVRRTCDGPPGSWGRPPVSDDDHLAKVRDCLGPALGEERMMRCVALVSRIDLLDRAGVAELLTLVGGVRGRRPADGTGRPAAGSVGAGSEGGRGE
jgi:aconitate decarboxylase